MVQIGRPKIFKNANIERFMLKAWKNVTIKKGFWVNVPTQVKMPEKEIDTMYVINFELDSKLGLAKPLLYVTHSSSEGRFSVVLLNSGLIDVEIKEGDVIGYVWYTKVKTS